MADVISRRSIVYDLTFNTTQAKKGATDIGGAMKSAEKQIDKATQSVDEFTSKTLSSVARLRQMKNELNNFKGTEAQFQKLSIEAAKLQDQIGRTNQRIRILASSTRNIQALTSAFQGITGVFVAAQGAQALFGKESENVTKALVKLQGAMALLQGVEAAVATVREQSVAKTVLMNGVTKAYTFVTNGATAATKLFRGALIGLGAVGVIGGLIAILGYWKDIKEAIFGANDAQKDFKAESAGLRAADAKREAELLAAQNKDNFEQRKRALENEIRELRATRTADAKEQAKLSKDILDRENELKILGINRDKELRKEELEQRVALMEALVEEVKKGTKARLDAETALLYEQERLEIESSSATGFKRLAIEQKFHRARMKLLEEFAIAQRKVGQNIKFDQPSDLDKLREEIGKAFGIDVDSAEDLGTRFGEAFKKAVEDEFDKEPKPITTLVEVPTAETETTIVSLRKVIKDNAEQISSDFASIFANLGSLAKEGSDAQIALSIANIFAANAEALANAIAKAANVPYPLNIPAIISSVATITGMFVQVHSLISKAKSAQANVQAFAEGEVDIHRPGEQAGKDSIPAVIMPGETVTTTDKTRKYKPFLEAIHEGSLEDLIRVNYVEPALALKALDNAANDSKQTDYSDKFYRQYLATGEGNVTGKRMLMVLASIDRKLSPKQPKLRN